jgi:sugar lactone lactonase YvrE
MLPTRIVRISRARRVAHRLKGYAFIAIMAVVAGCNVAPAPAPARIDLSAQPNGIVVRPSDSALFVTDDRSNAILWSSDRKTWTPYASLPVVAGQPSSLSQLVFGQPETLLVERFGFGDAGGLFVVSPEGQAQALTGLATERRRLGLASIGPGRALSSWFIKQGSEPPNGGVSLVSYDVSTHAAVERDLIVGLAKPVGIATQDSVLFVADQNRGEILRYDLGALLAAPAPARDGAVFARIESPDLLAIDRAGVLYTKCHAHGFCRIAPDGAVTSLADDFQDARGVAIDDTRHVLYVVDRAKSASGSASAIRVFPLGSSDVSADR